MRTERADEILRVAVVTLAAAAMIALLAGLAVAMRNSVETHTLGISAPPLDDEAQVALGLGHYQGACQPCHGAPGVASNLVARQMLLSPPYLPSSTRSGCPIWPASST